MIISVEIADEEAVQLDMVDVDVEPGGSLTFQVEGRISGLEDAVLDELRGETVHPVRVEFERR